MAAKSEPQFGHIFCIVLCCVAAAGEWVERVDFARGCSSF